MAVDSTGRFGIVAMTAGTTWRTAVAVGALDGLIPISIDPISLQGDPVPEMGIANFDEMSEMDNIAVEANPTMVAKLRREGAIWKPMAGLFGDDTVTGAGPVFTHTFNWQQTGLLFHTMAAEIGSADIWEWPSLQCVAAILEQDGEGWVQVSYEFIGNTIQIAGDAVNVAGDFDNVTYDTKVKKIRFKNSRLRINLQGGGALGSADEQALESWRLEIRRPMEREDVIQGASDGTELETDQPVQEGFSAPLIKLAMTLKDYDKEATDNSLFDDLKDETEYKADITFARTIGSDAHNIIFQLPRLHPMPQEAGFDSINRIPLTRNFSTLDAAANPIGMSINTIVHLVVDDLVSLSYEL